MRSSRSWHKDRVFEVSSTALHIADIQGNMDVVRVLLAVGVDVNARNNASRTALFWAALHGYICVVRALLDAGTDVDVNRIVTEKGCIVDRDDLQPFRGGSLPAERGCKEVMVFILVGV